MKAATLLLLLILASCGGGGSSTPSVDAQRRSSLETERKEKELKCLEETLGWIEAPPMDKKEVLVKMSSVAFEACASLEILDLYIERVMLAHPQVNF